MFYFCNTPISMNPQRRQADPEDSDRSKFLLAESPRISLLESHTNPQIRSSTIYIVKITLENISAITAMSKSTRVDCLNLV